MGGAESREQPHQGWCEAGAAFCGAVPSALASPSGSLAPLARPSPSSARCESFSPWPLLWGARGAVGGRTGRHGYHSPSSARPHSALASFLPGRTHSRGLSSPRNTKHSPFRSAARGRRPPPALPAPAPPNENASDPSGLGTLEVLLILLQTVVLGVFSGLFSQSSLTSNTSRKALPAIPAKEHTLSPMLPHTSVLNGACEDLNLFH